MNFSASPNNLKSSTCARPRSLPAAAEKQSKPIVRCNLWETNRKRWPNKCCAPHTHFLLFSFLLFVWYTRWAHNLPVRIRCSPCSKAAGSVWRACWAEIVAGPRKTPRARPHSHRWPCAWCWRHPPRSYSPTPCAAPSCGTEGKFIQLALGLVLFSLSPCVFCEGRKGGGRADVNGIRNFAIASPFNTFLSIFRVVCGWNNQSEA